MPWQSSWRGALLQERGENKISNSFANRLILFPPNQRPAAPQITPEAWGSAGSCSGVRAADMQLQIFQLGNICQCKEQHKGLFPSLSALAADGVSKGKYFLCLK